MPYTETYDSIAYGFTTLLLVILVIALIVIPMVIVFINNISIMRKKIGYYKMELSRSASENERKFWKRKLRRYYLSLIPVVNIFVRKNSRRKHK